MSLIRLFFNPLDAKAVEEHEIEPGREIIKWLVEHYPLGFDGGIRVFAGIEEIAVKDLDRPVEQDEQITILVMPAGIELTAAAVGTYLLQAAIAFAIGYIINLIFAPDTPGQPRAGEQSSVYSIGPARNQVRLGEPVEVVYGTVTYPPSFASVPYVFNVEASNDQFADHLLCLGQGYFNINQIYIGDTPVTALGSGTVQWWVFGPDDHNSTAGVIEDEIWSQVENSDTPFRFYEDMYTSPEVENWEFRDRITETTTAPAALTGDAYAQSIGAGGETILSHIITSDVFDIAVGDDLTLAGSTSNNGTFKVGSVVRDVAGPGLTTIFTQWGSSTQFVDEQPLNGATTYEVNSVANDAIAGPFRCQPEGKQIREIIVDHTFPQGLFYTDIDNDDFNIQQSTYNLNMRIQEIDETTGSPIGAPVDQPYSIVSSTQATYRVSHSSGPLTPGFYEVTISRVGGFNDYRSTENMSLTGLRGVLVLDETPGAAYGPVTLLAVRMKATQGLGESARSRIRVRATRVLDPTDLTIKSANPMTAIKDVWTNEVYGLKRPLAELDLAHIDPIEQEWQVEGYGPRVNGAFDQRDTGYHAMQVIASMTGSKVVQDGGFTTVIQEKRQAVRKALFSSANIVRNSLEIVYNFDTQGEYDGIQVEYRNPVTFDPLYATYPVSPEPEVPDTLVLFGVTDEVYAGQMARYFYNVKDNRRKLVVFDVELDGWLVKFGDRFGISMPMPNWGQSGVIVEVLSAMEVRVDQALDWSGDDWVLLRDDYGAPDGPYQVTEGASPDIVVFGEVPGIPLYDMEGREPSSYVFGEADTMVMDFMVSRVSPQGETIFRIEGQTYSDLIYDGAPPHMRGVGQGYSELLFASDEAATGFTANHSLIITNQQDPENPDPENDGQKIMIAPTGSSWTQYSDDGGQTWGSKVSVSGSNDTGYNITNMQYAPWDGSWWALWYNNSGSNRSRRIYRSTDDGATWVYTVGQHPNDYSYGFLVESDDTVHVGGRADNSGASAPLELWTKTPGTPPLWDPRVDADTAFQPLTSPYSTSWSVVYLGQKDSVNQYYKAIAAENSQQHGIVIWPGHTIDGPYIYTDADHSSENVRLVCTKGDDRALIYASGGGTSVHTYEKFDMSVVPGAPFSTVDIDFGFNCARGIMCYSQFDDRYYCFAFEVSPNQHILHVAYTDASGALDSWTNHPPIDVVYGLDTTNLVLHAQWAYDQTFYLGYERGEYSHQSGQNKTFLKVVLFADSPNPPQPVSHLMANWESGEVNVVTQGRNFNHMSFAASDDMFVSSIDPRFGSNSVYGDAQDSGLGFLYQSMGNEPWDFNNFTFDVSFKVIDFTGEVPIFRYGNGSSFSEHLQMWVRTDGQLVARRRGNSSSDTQWIVNTSAGAINSGVWYDVRLIVNPYHAALYLDGTLVVKDRHAGKPRDGSGNDFYLGGGRSGGTSDDQSFIYCDSHFDNLRVSHGTYPFTDYVPSEYIAPPRPTGTLNQSSFSADNTSAEVGRAFSEIGSPTHNTSTPLHGAGSVDLNGTSDYLNMNLPELNPHHFTAQFSFRLDSLADLSLSNPIWTYGWANQFDFRLFVRVTHSGHATNPTELHLYYENDNVVEVSIFGGATIAVNTIYDVAIELYPDGLGDIVANLFVNGTKVATTTFADSVVYQGGSNVRFGFAYLSSGAPNNNYLHGTVDEHRIDNQVALFNGSNYTPSLPFS